MRIASFLFILGLSLNAQAGAIPDCHFKSVVAFGASITQAMPRMVPMYGTGVAAIELYESMWPSPLPRDKSSPLLNYTSRPYGQSPIRYLVKNLAGKAALKNIHYTGIAFTSSDEEIGMAQVRDLLAGKNRELFENASLLVGVDAFYWDAIYNACDYGRNGGVEEAIQILIQATRQKGIPLILGNIPLEQPNTVRVDALRTGISGLWYAPKVSCVKSINRTLEQYCRPEAQCYIVDLRGAAADLQCGKKLKLRNGEEYGLYEMRPDGVHMSDKGSRYIAEMMMQALENNPPACSR